VEPPPLSPDLLLRAYFSGVFPMADPREGDAIYWYAPDPRAVLPLGGFRAPKSLRKTVRKAPFRVTTNRAFGAVLEACAAPGQGRESTWISEEVAQAYGALHRLGYAHSVECWEGGVLAGGLYGVALGGAFFGESMFHRATDASKVAFVHLVAHLRRCGFTLLDVQFTTPHLARFGVVEIPRKEYERRLAESVRRVAAWQRLETDPEAVLAAALSGSR
jgi:leucyl/phenylalanyl-tRNA--protein transferase